MVDHLTRVTVRGPGPRAEAIAGALGELGFALRREGRHLVADSATVEAGAVRRHLRGRGVEDREYQLLVEFVRRWGVL